MTHTAKCNAATVVALIEAGDGVLDNILPPMTVDLIADAVMHTTMHWVHVRITRRKPSRGLSAPINAGKCIARPTAATVAASADFYRLLTAS